MTSGGPAYPHHPIAMGSRDVPPIRAENRGRITGLVEKCISILKNFATGWMVKRLACPTDLGNRDEIRRNAFEAHACQILSLDFLPNGRLLVSDLVGLRSKSHWKATWTG